MEKEDDFKAFRGVLFGLFFDAITLALIGGFIWLIWFTWDFWYFVFSLWWLGLK